MSLCLPLTAPKAIQGRSPPALTILRIPGRDGPSLSLGSRPLSVLFSVPLDTNKCLEEAALGLLLGKRARD